MAQLINACASVGLCVCAAVESPVLDAVCSSPGTNRGISGTAMIGAATPDRSTVHATVVLDLVA